MFDRVPVALWDQDFSRVLDWFDALRAKDVTDLRAHLTANPEDLAEVLACVTIRDVNDYAVRLLEAASKADVLENVASVFVAETGSTFVEELVALWEGRPQFESETMLRTFKGNEINVSFTVAWEGARAEHTFVSMTDISAQKTSERRLETINRVAQILTSELDLERTVQLVTDIATELTGARGSPRVSPAGAPASRREKSRSASSAGRRRASWII